MAAPIAYINYTHSGLSFSFKDRSVGVVNTHLWNFGDNTTSTLKDPPPKVYATEGIYNISLTVSNNEGQNTYETQIIASPNPSLIFPIQEMVRRELPAGIKLDSVSFDHAITKWMLFFQGAEGIKDEDVFNELKWRPLTRVLISKMIIYDLITQAAESSMVSFIASQQQYNENIANAVSTSTLQVADYLANVNLDLLLSSGTITGVTIRVNGADLGPSGNMSTITTMEAYLNSLGKGQFIYDHGTDKLISRANSNTLTAFSFHHSDMGAVNSTFTQENIRVVPVTQSITQSSSGSVPGGKGPVKSMEAGPSKVEWYDASTYWSNLLKGSSGLGGLNGSGQGGVMSILAADICLYAGRLGIHLDMCGPRKTGSPIRVSYAERRWRKIL